MGMLDHWHPVVPASKLKSKPVEVKLAGRTLCLFRTSTGEPAAVDNVCPHRRLKLSYGTVVGDRIQCRYHGWTFDAGGRGESPSTPKMHTCTDAFDCREEHGYVWVKSKDSDPIFPAFETAGYYCLGDLYHVAPAPLELTVDNFNEIEHSGTVHDTFGYDLDRMHEVTVRFEPTDDAVTVVNSGPTKRVPGWMGLLLGIRHGDIFHDTWTTRFSPVYSVFDHWWTSPDGTREAMMRWRIYIFFVPLDADATAAVSFVYAKSRFRGPAGGLRIAKHIFRREVDREIRQDVSMLEHMADKTVGIDGLKLSRFDRVLGLTRERINRIYRGEGDRVALATR